MKTIKKLILCLFIVISSSTYAQKKELKSSTNRTVTADMNEVAGATKTVWRKCVGAGRANEGLRTEWQEQLKQVKKDIGFEYIRMHGLLHDDMGVYFEENDKPVYNWVYIDMLYDFLININVKPYVELTFMPKALSSSPETVFWWKGNITPPKDYDKWYDFMKALTEHFTERYGADEVKTWYFEVWNEPNHKSFFKGDMETYFKLYDYTARAIKSVNKDYRVGGPATAGNKWVPEIIDYCDKNNVALDFIATHTYAVTKGNFEDDVKKSGLFFSQDPMAITADVIKSKEQIKASTKPNLDLHYTEWSSSFSGKDPIHDTYQSAAFILDKIKGTESVATAMSYWTFTDIFEEGGPRANPFHGGFGLLNYHSIKKPSYYAYAFLNKLGETEIKSSDKASWVCKNQNGDIQSLVWDFTLTKPTDNAPNGIYYKRDIPANNKGSVDLKFTNVPSGKYKLTAVKVGYQSNDVYASYMKMGSPQQLTRSQVKTLKDENAGSPIIEKEIEVKNDKLFNYQLPMRENDVYFVNLEKL